IAHSALRVTAATVPEKIAHSQELYSLLKGTNATVGRLAIELVSLLLTVGRIEDAEEFLAEAIGEHPNDPYLMNFVQKAMETQFAPMDSLAGLSADSLKNRMSHPAPKSESGAALVLPGQEPTAPQ